MLDTPQGRRYQTPVLVSVPPPAFGARVAWPKRGGVSLRHQALPGDDESLATGNRGATRQSRSLATAAERVASQHSCQSRSIASLTVQPHSLPPRALASRREGCRDGADRHGTSQSRSARACVGVAQSVELLFCKQGVRGSSPLASSRAAGAAGRVDGPSGRARFGKSLESRRVARAAKGSRL